jgi:hypothetical protein
MLQSEAREPVDDGIARSTGIRANYVTSQSVETGLCGAQPACPQLQVISGLSDAPSQKVPQNLLSFAARHEHDGCAHLSA